MAATLVTHGTVVTVNPRREIISDGAILVVDGRIARIGSAAEMADTSAETVVDASGQVVMPGLINAHTHTAYYIMRGLGMDRILLDWLQETVWPWLTAMDEEDVYIASMLGYVECLRSGTTSLIDNQNYPTYHNHHYDAAARAAARSGLRVTFACGFSDIRFVSPPDFIDVPERIEAECRRMIRTWHGQGRLAVVISPINLLYCSEESIRRALKVMRDTGVGMHTHVAESKQEYQAMVERLGKGYLEAFHDMGAMSDRFQSVHSVWISDHEIELLAQAHATVVYNPTANMLLASGIAPITKLQAAGVNVALGTDNPNNSNDMLEAMKFAGLLQKVGTLEPLATPAPDVLEMATINGARALHLADRIGSLEVGKQADLILVDMRRLHNTPMHDPVAALVYSASGSDVTYVMVDGEILLREGQVTFLDEGDLIADGQRRADACAERVRLARHAAAARTDP
jgi:5-methylthioadenosine/S-adenosylhomocysteine deaminase